MYKEVYQLIFDEDELRKYLEVLPKLERNETFYITLFARKKYTENPACKYDKTQLKRFTTTADRLIEKLHQLECPVGSYTGHNNLPIPQESLAVYINPNPRSLSRSLIRGIQALASSIDKEGEHPNPRQAIMNVLQTTKSRTAFHVFDIDSKDLSIIDKVREITNDNFFYVETRGGFHLYLDQNKIDKFSKNWYVTIKNLPNVDVTGDMLTPLPGSVQGNFIPKIVK